MNAKDWLRVCVPRTVGGGCLLIAWLAVAAWAWSRPTPRGTFADPANLEAVGFRLDVNAADAETLVALHGIGPALARRIVDHRAVHGPFAGPDSLQRVSGIGPRTAARVAPWLRFD
ncbi:MAG: helix-hairpin-helix domain-containing protein [Planctomycetota bacterium]